MHTIIAENINDLYVKLSSSVLDGYDNMVYPRGIKCFELQNVMAILTRPRCRILTYKERDLSLKYLVGELCFYLSGSDSLEFISHYAKFWEKVSDNNITVNSAYGKRLFFDMPGQFDYVIEELKRDKDSRKAVMTIYNREDAKESKDNPCTMYLNFMIREERLMLTTHMRSNDLWLGTPYDIAFFSLLQEIVFLELKENYPDLRLGVYNHFVNSLHAYEKDVLKLSEIYKHHSWTSHDDDCTMTPALELVDVDTWFTDLLWAEEQIRKVKNKNVARDFATPFQSWCIEKLR